MPPERITSNQTVVHHDSWSSDPEQHKDEAAREEPEENHDEKTQAEARERQIDRIEAQIQAAARAVVASIEQENCTGNDSVLSSQTDESYKGDGTELSYGDGTELTYGDGTELTYGDGTEATYESDNEHHSEHGEADGEGDSSSHHDGDIDDDDVFSRDSGRSARSSLNSCHDLHSSDETYTQKQLTSPIIGEEAATIDEEPPISRIPSAASYLQNSLETTPRTPSKVLNRPPFRTPSSVRAMQMSSPTPSIFSSPRSAKRHLPTVSRLGTPTSHTSKNRTPTRFKVKKEYPLILLHVTVLPLQWLYSHVMSSPDLPSSLQDVKETWRMLQEKLGDTVLERGILLPHPQDSYEVLEERLLEALELPVRPRARILKCGHYMGPLDSETPSDEESGGYFEGAGTERRWCDICGRDVRLENNGPRAGETMFRIKIYASNGLMRAGAWAAAWREMERVDVEIEPFVETHLAEPLEHLASIHKMDPEPEDEFVDEEEEEEVVEHIHAKPVDEHDEKIRAKEEKMRRKAMEEERMREIYGHDAPRMDSPRPRPRRRSSRSVHGDSLPELLLAAFKVAMRDQKNVAIGVLSVIILLLALWPRGTVENVPAVIRTDPIAVPEVVTHFVTETVPAVKEAIPTAIETMEEIPPKIAEIAEEFMKETTGPVGEDSPIDKIQTPNSMDAPAPEPPTTDSPMYKQVEVIN